MSTNNIKELLVTRITVGRQGDFRNTDELDEWLQNNSWAQLEINFLYDPTSFISNWAWAKRTVYYCPLPVINFAVAPPIVFEKEQTPIDSNLIHGIMAKV